MINNDICRVIRIAKKVLNISYLRYNPYCGDSEDCQ